MSFRINPETVRQQETLGSVKSDVLCTEFDSKLKAAVDSLLGALETRDPQSTSELIDLGSQKSALKWLDD